MGAFDSYAARIACPDCGDVHDLSGQTKFFDPDYDDQRWFEIGQPQPASFTMADLPGGDWLRMRPPTGDDTRVTLLEDFDELFVCGCGRWIATLLHFVLAPGLVTLDRIELLDARGYIADRCDFVDAQPLWQGSYDAQAVAIRALEARPFEDRAAWLRQRLDARFELPDQVDEDPAIDGCLVGPTTCEACGDVRERTTHHWFLASFFEPPGPAGAIFLGAQLPFDDAWLAEDLDRGRYFRARHPVGETELLLLGGRLRFGCRCGAGIARAVARFARRPGALELVELTLRAVAGRDDVRDIDFIEGEIRTPALPRHALLDRL